MHDRRDVPQEGGLTAYRNLPRLDPEGNEKTKRAKRQTNQTRQCVCAGQCVGREGRLLRPPVKTPHTDIGWARGVKRSVKGKIVRTPAPLSSWLWQQMTNKTDGTHSSRRPVWTPVGPINFKLRYDHRLIMNDRSFLLTCSVQRRARSRSPLRGALCSPARRTIRSWDRGMH